ncbi:hypothetical protein ANO11243_004500 [Dothideomycetidae sp. 11243]|nr:hypothetical protein ANO11243_004500 [fungal sp. No.11243]
MQFPPIGSDERRREVSVASLINRPRTLSDASAASRSSTPMRRLPSTFSTVDTPLAGPEELQRNVKRTSPTRNEHGQYVCDVSLNCAGVVFNRKCEWSKHTDRHDRPYCCKHPTCTKLQGFTYSGGLLRHEREVHGKHGGPKDRLRCPFPHCKRHDGLEFTRKENLAEHIRRVHEKRREDATGTTSSEHAPRLSPPGSTGSPGRKRDWANTQSPELSAGDKVLWSEIGRLELENQTLRQQVKELRNELDSARAATSADATTTLDFRSL